MGRGKARKRKAEKRKGGRRKSAKARKRKAKGGKQQKIANVTGLNRCLGMEAQAQPLRNTHYAPRNSSRATSAYIPFHYISDSRQRIEIYRKIAQATDQPSLQALETELRDRFGPVPPAVGLLLQVAELKYLAAARGINAIEVKEDKLMLSRNNDYIMVGTKFPRLTKKEAGARLREIKKLLMAI